MLRFLAPLLVAGLLLAAPPIGAADKTELISLTHISAAELDDLLSTGRVGSIPVVIDGQPEGPPDAAPPKMNLVPAGIIAWAVDLRNNALSVSGDAESVQQLRRIIRLLDIPARRLRIFSRIVQLDVPTAAALREKADVVEQQGLKILVLPAAERAALDARPALQAATVDVSNNRRVYLRRAAGAWHPVREVTLQPRVNGDNTITLFTTGLFDDRARKGSIAALRVSHGVPVLLLDSQNRAWVITPEILPEPING
jgi:hypothetical protein